MCIFIQFYHLRIFIETIASHTGETNKHRYVVATQSHPLRVKLRSIPATPIIHINRSVTVLEPPSDATLQAKARVSQFIFTFFAVKNLEGLDGRTETARRRTGFSIGRHFHVSRETEKAERTQRTQSPQRQKEKGTRRLEAKYTEK